MRRKASRARCCAPPCVVLLLLIAGCARPRVAAGPLGSDDATTHSAVAVTPRLFEFHSSFWLNLHHFLYVQARARTGRDAGRETVTAALGDTAGLGRRPASERAAWQAALAYYDSALAGRDAVFDSGMVTWKNRLAGLAGGVPLARSGLDSTLAHVLERAAPVYRAVWWERHDAANRAWVRRLLPLLQAHGDSIAAGVTRALRVPWPPHPVRVDVSAYTNWAGAYTTERPSHVMISSLAEGYRDTLGLEMLFHESMHTLEDTLAAARSRARAASGKRVPYDVVHAIIFYTAGEVTRRTVPGHVPYIEARGMLQRGSMSRFYPIIRRQWQPYLDGQRSFDEAIAGIVGEL